jgi:hypothetical protein
VSSRASAALSRASAASYPACPRPPAVRSAALSILVRRTNVSQKFVLRGEGVCKVTGRLREAAPHLVCDTAGERAGGGCGAGAGPAWWDETCPVSTGGGTRRVQLVREGWGCGGGLSRGEAALVDPIVDVPVHPLVDLPLPRPRAPAPPRPAQRPAPLGAPGAARALVGCGAGRGRRSGEGVR